MHFCCPVSQSCGSRIRWPLHRLSGLRRPEQPVLDPAGGDGEHQMRMGIVGIGVGCVCTGAIVCDTATAQDHGFATPSLVLEQLVAGLPREDKQAVRVLTASFKPGDKTVTHTHRFPVTVYVMEGSFTLELEGRAPLTVNTGGAMVEPPHVKMTGYNRSAAEPLRGVIFY